VNKPFRLALVVSLCFLVTPAFAQVSHKTVAYRKVVKRGSHRHVVYRKRPEQQRVFSFIDTPKTAQPANTSVELASPLTGMVVKHQNKTSSQDTKNENSGFASVLNSSVVTNPRSYYQPIASWSGGIPKSTEPALVQPETPQSTPIDTSVQSWSMPITAKTATKLAKSMATVMAHQMDPSTSTLYLAPSTTDSSASPLPQALSLALRKAGFALANALNQLPETKTLQYFVTPLAMDGKQGILVRMNIDGRETSSWFQQKRSGSLLAASAFTVKEAQP
jgi:hypothetical protein